MLLCVVHIPKSSGLKKKAEVIFLFYCKPILWKDRGQKCVQTSDTTPLAVSLSVALSPIDFSS